MTLVISFGNMDQTPLQDDVVITVNGEEITLFEFQEEFSNKLVEFQDLLGDEVPEVLEQTIKESAAEDLIIRRLLLDYLSNSGYRVSPEYVAELIRTNETFLLTILHANNEIGNIYPVKEIGELCKKNDILFHVDGAQSVGKINVNVANLNIDILSFSSHKIYGPKGIGGLYIKHKSPKIHL